MNFRITEEIRINSAKIVTKSISEYERAFGGFKISAVKTRFNDLGLELVLRLTDKLEEKQQTNELSIVEFKNILLSILFELQFDESTIYNLLTTIEGELKSFVKQSQGFNINIVNLINDYFILFREKITDYSFYASSTALDIIRAQPEYQILDSQYPIVVREYDKITTTVYTMFPKERYWEEYKNLPSRTTYSPFKSQRLSVKVGGDGDGSSYIYEDLIIYEGELYKLRPGTTSVNKSYFDPEQWEQYKPRRFDKSKSFRSVYLDRIKSAFGKFSEVGFDINGIISDSKVSEFSEDTYIDPELLNSTFSGYGNQIFYSTKELKYLVQAFGGYQGSLVGGVDYVSSYLEYLLVSALGKTPTGVFNQIGDNTIFGRFDVLYSTPIKENSVPGLKFLENFNKLKSFVHGQLAPKYYFESSGKTIYNAVYVQYKDGLKNLFGGFFNKSSYQEAPNFDLLLYAIENLYFRCTVLGDSLDAIYTSLDVHGRLKGYEGLGSIEPQISELQNIFPPQRKLDEMFLSTEIKPGLTGAIEYLLRGYSSFSQVFDVPVFPGKSLEFFGLWIEKISNQISKVTSVLSELGLGTKSFIPNLSFKFFESKDSRLVDFLRSLGFRDSEISNLLEIQSFPELVTKFAPLSNSSDLKSFFKAYELCQLIYEFGGQDGIDAYLRYLFSRGELESLLNLLDISQKDPSDISHWNMSRYPKLIGLLIGLTYAIDPNQLLKFNNILRQNNLTLLESISFLFQKGETTIIKSPEDIDMISPLVEQMITGVYKQDALSSPSSDYDMVTSTAPLALREWTKIIGDNLGKLSSTDLIRRIYDRSSGLTPKELITILGNPSSLNSFGSLVDGFSGGDFTSFIKYANMSGLGVKLGFYKNSYQTNNFYVDTAKTSFVFSDLLASLGSINESLQAIRTVFDASLDYNFDLNSTFSSSLEPLVLSQNKTFESLSNVIEQMSSGESLAGMLRTASDSTIAESPGTGNSRVPNRVPARNSVTPEQARALVASAVNSAVPNEISTQSGRNLISTFIKFSEANELLSNIVTTDEALQLRNFKSRDVGKKVSSKFQTEGTGVLVSPKPYTIPEVYQKRDSNLEVKSSALGANYLSQINQQSDINIAPGISVSAFNPVSSCRRFGGTNCEQLYANSQQVCRNLFNKALFPETYSEVPGLSPASVPIDRPLGTFADYKPLTPLLSTSLPQSPPSFYSMLPASTRIGVKGEPILTQVNTDPTVPDSGGAELNEYANTEFAMVQFIRAKLERNDEFNCATFESPFHYQMCMNIMKCKRFFPPYNDEYFLDFCPRTLSGGRLK